MCASSMTIEKNSVYRKGLQLSVTRPTQEVRLVNLLEGGWDENSSIKRTYSVLLNSKNLDLRCIKNGL